MGPSRAMFALVRPPLWITACQRDMAVGAIASSCGDRPDRTRSISPWGPPPPLPASIAAQPTLGRAGGALLRNLLWDWEALRRKPPGGQPRAAGTTSSLVAARRRGGETPVAAASKSRRYGKLMTCWEILRALHRLHNFCAGNVCEHRTMQQSVPVCLHTYTLV